MNRLTLSRPLGEPRFDQAYSGWYWEIAVGSTPLLRSRSLWDQSLAAQRSSRERPRSLFARRRSARRQSRCGWSSARSALPAARERFRYAVAGDRSEIDAEIRSFNSTLGWSLGILGLGLLVALLPAGALRPAAAAPHPPGHRRRAHRHARSGSKANSRSRSSRSPDELNIAASIITPPWSSAPARKSATSPMP